MSRLAISSHLVFFAGGVLLSEASTSAAADRAARESTCIAATIAPRVRGRVDRLVA